MKQTTLTRFNDLTRDIMPRAKLPADKMSLAIKLGTAAGFLQCRNIEKAVEILNNAGEIAKRVNVKRKLDELIVAVQGETSTAMRRP